MALTSRRFAGVAELEACAVDDSAHLLLGSQGSHVALVQQALIDLGEQIESGATGTYGRDTEAAVTSYKTARSILNVAGLIDPIVGKKTIAALDLEIERFDAAGGEEGTRLRFVGLDQDVDTDLGFDEVVELVETALRAGELLRLTPRQGPARALNPQQLISIERI
jgi:hypothetical protein